MKTIEQILTNKEFLLPYHYETPNRWDFRFKIIILGFKNQEIHVLFIEFHQYNGSWQNVVEPDFTENVLKYMKRSVLAHLQQYLGNKILEYEIHFFIPIMEY